MNEFLSLSPTQELEKEDYSIEEDVKEILRQPLIDILVALMLINDIFQFLRGEIK
ncbi:MAG TPA: hypothetical protein VMV49_04335 [Candidatus Deferrimicrobium sp.]|nr:hypothetical protein [Candidatus Deferrimicrobium sp.]